MTTNHAYLTKKIKVRDDHLAALTAKCKAMGETVTLDFYVNDALAQYLKPALSDEMKRTLGGSSEAARQIAERAKDDSK